MESLLPQITFGYGRVSTGKQPLSREAQTETVARWTEYHAGGAPHEMFFDEDTSGGTPFAERPAGRQLLAAVRAAVSNGSSVTLVVTPGAIYHVMNRGDRREPIFLDDEDRQRFLTA